MKVSAGFVYALVFAALAVVPVTAAAHAVRPGAGPGRITAYAGTPAGIFGTASAGDSGAKSGTATDEGRNALEIPEPAVIALFGLVALAIGHRLRRAKA